MGKQVEISVEEELVRQNINFLGIKLYSFEVIFSLLKNIRIWFTAFSLLIISFIIFISKPRYTGVTSLGWSGISIGFPFFFIKRLPIPNDIQQVPSVTNLVENVLGTLSIFLFVILIIGIIVLISGYVWRHYYKKINKNLNQQKNNKT